MHHIRYADPMAPPDATRPTAEDNLHLGCQWRVPSSGLKIEVYNAVGRHAMGVAGMHLVNRIRGQHGAQGKRAVGRAKKWMIREDAQSKKKEQHCTLVCEAKALLALSDMLLTFVVPEHTYHKTEAASYATPMPSATLDTSKKAVYEVTRMRVHRCDSFVCFIEIPPLILACSRTSECSVTFAQIIKGGVNTSKLTNQICLTRNQTFFPSLYCFAGGAVPTFLCRNPVPSVPASGRQC